MSAGAVESTFAHMISTIVHDVQNLHYSGVALSKLDMWPELSSTLSKGITAPV